MSSRLWIVNALGLGAIAAGLFSAARLTPLEPAQAGYETAPALCFDNLASAEILLHRLEQDRIITARTYDEGLAGIYVAPNGDWSMLIQVADQTCISDYGSDWSHKPQGGL